MVAQARSCGQKPIPCAWRRPTIGALTAWAAGTWARRPDDRHRLEHGGEAGAEPEPGAAPLGARAQAALRRPGRSRSRGWERPAPQGTRPCRRGPVRSRRAQRCIHDRSGDGSTVPARGRGSIGTPGAGASGRVGVSAAGGVADRTFGDAATRSATSSSLSCSVGKPACPSPPRTRRTPWTVSSFAPSFTITDFATSSSLAAFPSPDGSRSQDLTASASASVSSRLTLCSTPSGRPLVTSMDMRWDIGSAGPALSLGCKPGRPSPLAFQGCSRPRASPSPPGVGRRPASLFRSTSSRSATSS